MSGDVERGARMSIARFTARDPYDSSATERELQNLVSRLAGVADYTIRPNGVVTIEYDRHRTSDEVIEDAFSRLGFETHHVMDELDANEVEVREALGD
jgi:hypothetical protein